MEDYSKSTTIQEEKRIYVVVAQTVQSDDNRTIVQVCGRAMAQACHAVGKLRYKMLNEIRLGEAITTICLAARDSAEMKHIVNLVVRADSPVSRNFVTFLDTNPEVYGRGEYLTSIAIGPCTARELTNITDYLPLWSHSAEVHNL